MSQQIGNVPLPLLQPGQQQATQQQQQLINMPIPTVISSSGSTKMISQQSPQMSQKSVKSENNYTTNKPERPMTPLGSQQQQQQQSRGNLQTQSNSSNVLNINNNQQMMAQGNVGVGGVIGGASSVKRSSNYQQIPAKVIHFLRMKIE